MLKKPGNLPHKIINFCNFTVFWKIGDILEIISFSTVLSPLLYSRMVILIIQKFIGGKFVWLFCDWQISKYARNNENESNF